MENQKSETIAPIIGSQTVRVLGAEELNLPEGARSIPFVIIDPDTGERQDLEIGGLEESECESEN